MAEVEITVWVQNCRVMNDRSKRLPCLGEGCVCRGMGVVDAMVITTPRRHDVRRWPIPLAEHSYP